MTQPPFLVARMQAVWKKCNLKQKQAFFFVLQELPVDGGWEQTVWLIKRHLVSRPFQLMISTACVTNAILFHRLTDLHAATLYVLQDTLLHGLLGGSVFLLSILTVTLTPICSLHDQVPPVLPSAALLSLNSQWCFLTF